MKQRFVPRAPLSFAALLAVLCLLCLGNAPADQQPPWNPASLWAVYPWLASNVPQDAAPAAGPARTIVLGDSLVYGNLLGYDVFNTAWEVGGATQSTAVAYAAAAASFVHFRNPNLLYFPGVGETPPDARGVAATPTVDRVLARHALPAGETGVLLLALGVNDARLIQWEAWYEGSGNFPAGSNLPADTRTVPYNLNDMEQQVEAIIDLAADARRCVVLVTPASWHGSNYSTYQYYVAERLRAISNRRSTAFLGDWNLDSLFRTDWFQDDDIHLTQPAEYRKKLGQYAQSALSSCPL